MDLCAPITGHPSLFSRVVEKNLSYLCHLLCVFTDIELVVNLAKYQLLLYLAVKTTTKVGPKVLALVAYFGAPVQNWLKKVMPSEL